MNKFLLILSSIALALPAGATPVHPHYTNNGQCAGAEGSGCRYSLEIVQPESLMVSVPNFGPSRMETVSFCLNDAGVDKYQSLTTDMEWETFEGCMREMT